MSFGKSVEKLSKVWPCQIVSKIMQNELRYEIIKNLKFLSISEFEQLFSKKLLKSIQTQNQTKISNKKLQDFWRLRHWGGGIGMDQENREETYISNSFLHGKSGKLISDKWRFYMSQSYHVSPASHLTVVPRYLRFKR